MLVNKGGIDGNRRLLMEVDNFPLVILFLQKKNNSLPWLVKKTLYFCSYIEREKSARSLDGHKTHIA